MFGGQEPGAPLQSPHAPSQQGCGETDVARPIDPQQIGPVAGRFRQAKGDVKHSRKTRDHRGDAGAGQGVANAVHEAPSTPFHPVIRAGPAEALKRCHAGSHGDGLAVIGAAMHDASRA